MQSFHQTIADVTLSLSLPDGVTVVEDDPPYAGFLHPSARGPNAVEFELDLTFDAPPHLDGLPVVFDTGEAWRVHSDGNDLLLSIQAPTGYGEHLWVVRLDGRGGRHTIHVDRRLARPADGGVELVNPLRYPLDQILMMHLAADLRCVIVHAAGLCRGGVGALFAGVSGAGKSTLTGLVATAGGFTHLSDDRVVVRGTEEGILVYGTPWPGEAGVAAPDVAPLGALVFLTQAADHDLLELGPRRALERLLPTISVLWYDPVRASAALEWCDVLLREIPAYELRFLPDEGVAGTIERLFAHLPG